MPDAAHRFVADLDAAVYKHQLSDEQALYLLVQVARDACVNRSLNWSGLINHIQGWGEWRGHDGYAELPSTPPGVGLFKVWNNN